MPPTAAEHEHIGSNILPPRIFQISRADVVADHVLKGFNDKFNSSDLRHKNVCTLCRLETTHV